MWLTVSASCLCRLAPRRSGTSSVTVWQPNKRVKKGWGRVMCTSCTAVLVAVTRNACSGRKRPWVVVWWWEQGALAKGAAVMQELHLVKSTSFCSSILILYHLFIPSVLFPLFLLFSALSQAWTEVLRRDEGCCCPRVVLSPLCSMTSQSDPSLFL